MSYLATSSYPTAKHSEHHHGDMLPIYLMVFVSLIILLALTWGAYYIPFEKVQVGDFNFGFLNTAIAFAIAITKSALVVLFFMHLRDSTKLIRVVAAAGFLWLLIMVLFTFADYLSRSNVPQTAGAPASMASMGQVNH